MDQQLPKHIGIGERVTVVYRDPLDDPQILIGTFIGHPPDALMVKADGRRITTIIRSRDLISVARCSGSAPPPPPPAPAAQLRRRPPRHGRAWAAGPPGTPGATPVDPRAVPRAPGSPGTSPGLPGLPGLRPETEPENAPRSEPGITPGSHPATPGTGAPGKSQRAGASG